MIDGGNMAEIENLDEVKAPAIDKDALIQELKMALVRRELRINELEIALYNHLNNNTNRIPEIAHNVCELDQEASVGAYNDGWLASQATLVFGAGAEIQLDFFLPENSDRPKRVTLRPEFGSPVEFVLERGAAVRHQLVVPVATARPVVEVEFEYPEPVNDDRRLGAILA
jgi:hypothetical protein